MTDLDQRRRMRHVHLRHQRQASGASLPGAVASLRSRRYAKPWTVTTTGVVRQREHQLQLAIRKGGSNMPDEMENVPADPAALPVRDADLCRVDADAHSA